MLGVSTVACKMSSEFLYQQLTGMHRGRKGVVAEMYYTLSPAATMWLHLCVCVTVCCFFFFLPLQPWGSVNLMASVIKISFQPAITHTQTHTRTNIYIYLPYIKEKMERLKKKGWLIDHQGLSIKHKQPSGCRHMLIHTESHCHTNYTDTTVHMYCM